MFLLSCTYEENVHIGHYTRIYILGMYDDQRTSNQALEMYKEACKRNKDRYCIDFLKFNPNRVGMSDKDRIKNPYNITFGIHEFNDGDPSIIYNNGFEYQYNKF